MLSNLYTLDICRYVTASKCVPSVVYCSDIPTKVEKPSQPQDVSTCILLCPPTVVSTDDTSYKVPTNMALTTLTNQPMSKQKPAVKPSQNLQRQTDVKKLPIVKMEPHQNSFPPSVATKSPPPRNHDNVYRSVSSQPPKLLPLLPPSSVEQHIAAGKRRSMPTLYSHHSIVPQTLFFKEEPPSSATYRTNGATSYSLAPVNGTSGAVISIPAPRFPPEPHRRPSAPAIPQYQPTKNNSSRSSPAAVATSRGLSSYKYNNRRMAPVSELLARMRGVPKSEISRMNSAPNAGKRARRLHTIVHAQVNVTYLYYVPQQIELLLIL